MKNKMPKKHTFGRIIKTLFQSYPVMVPFIIVCIIFAGVVAIVPDIFIKQIVEILTIALNERWGWDYTSTQIAPKIIILVSLYATSLVLTFIQTQMLAIMTQGYLSKMRKKMFNGMQNLPIKFFDTTKHGDIMSYYTNDIDTLRELVSGSFPAIIRSSVIVIGVLGVMIYFSLWLTGIVLIAVLFMLFVSKKIGGGSAKYHIKVHKSFGQMEAYVQEAMNGQKVIKVFNHEEKSEETYNNVVENLFQDAYKANAYGNILGPIIMNIGNILYVIIALVSGILIYKGAGNISISGAALDLSIAVVFLSMTKQFTGNVNQISQQINSIVMSLAGAGRVFSLMDQKAEVDDGYVTLVNCYVDEEGNITETTERSGKWAWKHPHQDGTTTYTLLTGDVVLTDVDFSYNESKQVLFDVSVYAKPGQKVAFVGATGAGKTTITNLINRFYDIADGKIRYDGININKIKKSDLRKSLGIVLQDTNLFTGTVMENIRYGYLEATDEECMEAAKLAGAHDFITRLPNGYNTELTNNGGNLSQGQRQLIAIARAAVANPPVMILDEATSSIDTRTEAIVQRGMDKLMEGRTVFVIAHRLSTVMNSDVIMVLDHGRIIERGSHDELIAARGTYYQLYTGAFELE